MHPCDYIALSEGHPLQGKSKLLSPTFSWRIISSSGLGLTLVASMLWVFSSFLPVDRWRSHISTIFRSFLDVNSTISETTDITSACILNVAYRDSSCPPENYPSLNFCWFTGTPFHPAVSSVAAP